MTGIEIAMTVLAALALAARIAGSRFFEGVNDLRAKTDGARCRCASWTFMLLLGVLSLLQGSYPLTVRLIGAGAILLSVGGLVWEISAVLALVSQQRNIQNIDFPDTVKQ